MSEVATDTGKAGYLTAWEKLRSSSVPPWVQSIRERGAESFGELDLPHSKQEAWRFTNVAPITGASFAPPVGAPASSVSPEALAPYRYEGLTHTLVFVDGFYAPALSHIGALPDGVQVCSLAEAFAQDNGTAQAHLDSLNASPRNAYTALNAAFVQDGCCVHLAKNVVVDDAIHVVFFATGTASKAQFPRVLVVAETGSQATIIESFAAADAAEEYFTDAVSEYVLAANSHVRSYKLVREQTAGYHLATQYVQQDRDSHFTSHIFNLGGRIVRNEIAVQLDGEGAGCSLHGLYLGEKGQLIDNHQSVTHAKPHCTSWIGYKGVLDGNSKAVYTGKIFVDRVAQKTDSNQLNQNLLLSDDAQIDTKPQLEIYADDVKCTHGATIGQFPPELINYFRSRGIAPDMAKAMLTYGFADEVVREVDVEPLRGFLESFVFDRYSP